MADASEDDELRDDTEGEDLPGNENAEDDDEKLNDDNDGDAAGRR